jgi:FkbM family methyltransferase
MPDRETPPNRQVVFMLVSTEHGPLITSRFDLRPGDIHSNPLLEQGVYEAPLILSVLDLLDLRRKHYGDGVFAIDCGAHIGIHTLEWSKLMTGWGEVLAFEAQERLSYVVAANITLNNCFNARVINAAVGNTDGTIRVPRIDYGRPSRFGSIEMKERPGQTENVGQPISYAEANLVPVQAIRLDSLNLARCDLIKIDVEGMEIETLEGARTTLTRHKPLLIIEVIKTDRNRLKSLLDALGYNLYQFGRIDILAAHRTDKCLPEIAARDWSKGH